MLGAQAMLGTRCLPVLQKALCDSVSSLHISHPCVSHCVSCSLSCRHLWVLRLGRQWQSCHISPVLLLLSHSPHEKQSEGPAQASK